MSDSSMPEPLQPEPSKPEPVRPEIALLDPRRLLRGEADRLHSWLEELVRELIPEADSFTVRFTDDAGIRRYNRDYRDQDEATDVLSFPGETTVEGRHLGDVLISVPTARRQAREAGQDVATEIRRLLLHGLLHCLGYDHETDDGAMDRLESRLARRWIEERRIEERRIGEQRVVQR